MWYMIVPIPSNDLPIHDTLPVHDSTLTPASLAHIHTLLQYTLVPHPRGPEFLAHITTTLYPAHLSKCKYIHEPRENVPHKYVLIIRELLSLQPSSGGSLPNAASGPFNLSPAQTLVFGLQVCNLYLQMPCRIQFTTL